MPDYWVRCPVTAPDGQSFDAATCIERVIGNAEAVHWNSGFDQTTILQAFETISSPSSWYHGPLPVPGRYDRDSLWRSLWVSPLCAGGGATATMKCSLTRNFEEPDDHDDSISWNLTATTTLAWQTEQELVFSRYAQPGRWNIWDGDSQVTVHRPYLVFHIDGSATSPRFAGFRIREITR